MLSVLSLLMILGAAVNSGNVFTSATREMSNISRGRRDDISITSMLQNLDTRMQNLQAKLTTTRSEMAAAKSELQTAQSRIQQLETTVQNQTSLIRNLQAELTTTTTSRIQQLETTAQLQQAKISLAAKAVAFSVQFSAEKVNIGSFNKLKFDVVLENTGSGYNVSTGDFLAPVSGTYAFFLSHMGTPEADVYLDIVQNGKTLESTYSTMSYDQGSSLVTCHLVKGDTVWVRHWIGNKMSGGKWTIFSGFLLHADL